MRQAFVRALCEEAGKNPKIYLLTGDLGFQVLDPFRSKFPKRFLNIGVAEANLATVAAGLASTGFIPFIYSIAAFVSMRPFEQIRNDISLQNRNVKIIGVGAGLAYTKAGPTHHSMEDIALMRALPNMTIVCPSDTDECYQATKQIARLKGPAYLRIERNPQDLQTPFKKPDFELGKGQLIKKGKKVAILTTGTKIAYASLISNTLSKMGINPAVYSFQTVNPLDEDLILKITKRFKTIVTLEEHRVTGGFGSAVAEFIVSPKNPNFNKVIKFGLKDSFCTISGDYETLLKHHAFTPEDIINSINKLKLKL